MGSITGNIGSAGSMTYFNKTTYLNCSCPAGYYPTQITFDGIGNEAYWKNNSSSAKRLDIHLVNSEGTLLVANIMILNLTGNGTNTTSKTTNSFDASGYVGQGIYIVGGNANGNIYLQNASAITVTTVGVSYTLTVNAGTGGSLSASPSGSVTVGTTVTLTPSANTGYSFSSYSTSPSTSISSNKFTMPASNLTVTANFTHNSYTLSKAVSPSGGGSVTLGSTSGYYGSVINISASATTGYAFSSWSTTGGTLGNKNSASTTITMPNGNATVTANFTHVTRTLSKASNPTDGGTVTLGATSGYYGSVINISASANTGYSFKNWTTTGGTLGNANSSSTTITLPNANATVTANFTHIVRYLYSVADPVEGGTVTLGASSGYYNSVINITATADPGYIFNGWTTTGGTIANANSAVTTITMPNSDATVTASFLHVVHSLSSAANPAEGGTVTLEADTGYYDSVINISASTATGYAFNRWTTSGGTLGNADAMATTITMPDDDATVTANFTHIERTITPVVNPEAGGTITLGSNTGYYQSVINISAVAATGYSFRNWVASSGTVADDTLTYTTITLPNENVTLTANFNHISYTLSSVVSPISGGTVTLGQSSGYYADEVSITATPATGYQFISWSAPSGTFADSTSASTTFTMPNENATVTATFEKITYTVSTSVNPAGYGTLTPSSATAQMGDNVMLMATPNGGYEFVDYTTSPTLTIVNNQFTMPASSVSITANFRIAAFPSTPSLDKSNYTGGDIARLTITPVSQNITHRYRIKFNDDMDTGWVNVSGSDLTANIVIPVEWSIYFDNRNTIADGVFTLETLYYGASVGSKEITGLTYSRLDGTSPKLIVWRCDENGVKDSLGEYAKYSIVLPSSIRTYSLSYDATTVQTPALTGDILPGNRYNFNLDNHYNVILSITYGTETFTMTRDIPKVILIKKTF